jgi:asparaginyl-tRNA synthetase
MSAPVASYGIQPPVFPIPQLCVAKDLVGSQVRIQGWIKQIRLAKGGKLLFLHVGSGASLKTMQVVFDVTEGFDQELTFESSVEVQGELVKSMGAEQDYEIRASKITLVGGCPSDYPFQKIGTAKEKGKQKEKRTAEDKAKDGYSAEYMRQFVHLRPKTQIFSTIQRIRHTIAMATYQFYDQQGYFLIHTPFMTTSDCEGAGETFKVSVDKEPAFFKDKTACLTVSGQLHLEPFACSMEKVFTFGPSFRAEKSSTSRHASEFLMLEIESSFAGLDDVIKISQDYLKFVFKKCLEKHKEDLTLLGQRYGKDIIAKLEQDISTEFGQITYTEAVDLLIKSGRQFDKPCEWGVDFSSDQERYLAEEVFKKPLYITHFPEAIKAFYMYKDELSEGSDPKRQTVASTDLLIPGIGELMGGSQREHRHDVLADKMKKQGLDYQWYLDTRKYGSVPHAGFGIGFERLIRYVTECDHIADVIPYPVRFEHITS